MNVGELIEEQAKDDDIRPRVCKWCKYYESLFVFQCLNKECQPIYCAHQSCGICNCDENYPEKIPKHCRHVCGKWGDSCKNFKEKNKQR